MPFKPLVTVALAAITALAGAAPASASGFTAPDLARLAGAHPHAPASVIVQFDAGVDPARALAMARGAGGRTITTVPIIHSVAMTAGAADLVALSHRAGVRAITLNARVKAQSTAVPVDAGSLATSFPRTVGASTLWGSGLTGAGVTVGVIDTGIAGNLPDFRRADGSSRVVESAVISRSATSANDLYGHGTHVAGIIAGNSSGRDAGDPAYGRYVGVAPGADLVSIKVGDDAGHATVLDVIKGLAFAIAHRRDANIRIVNLSLESTQAQSYRTDPLDAAVEAAWANGIVVVAAAGNRGTAGDAVDYAPANDPYVITVGAVDDHGTPDTSDDTPAAWSSYGTTQDGFHKPDVSAPGAHVVSVLAPGSAFASLCPICIVGTGYFRVGGTSMSAPVVSGVAALLLQQRPDLSPDEVKGILVHSAAAVAAGGAPEVDAAAAAKTASTGPDVNAGLTHSRWFSAVESRINLSASSWSASSWSVAPPRLTAGWAASSWSASSWSASSWSASSWSASSWSSGWNL